MNRETEKSKLELKEMYDKEAEDKLDYIAPSNVYSLDKFPPALRYFYSKKISTMIKLSGIKKGDHILEVGCKDGVLTFILAHMGYKLTAVDLSPNSIELAKRTAKANNISNINFSVADAEDLTQFPDNHFDAVISFSVLRYLPKAHKAMKEIYRVLKRNAPAVVDFPNSLCPWFKLIKPVFGLEPHIHDHTYTPREVKELIRESGFSDIKTKLLLYTYKNASLPLFLMLRTCGEVLERIPIVRNTAAIIMCRGIKA